ncbi:MAG TPA: tetratricopeptide repeat protein, partial [Desulfobacteraceae bacterium]|nr:tetratricopeptide repeat protein [Desulfobacteraceae bacterium]
EQDFRKAGEAFQTAINLGLKDEEKEIAGKLLVDIKDPESLYAGIKEEIDRALKENDLDHALRLTVKALDLLPGNADMIDNLGWVYLKKGSVLLAKKHFNEAINLKPDNPLFHYHLGMAYYEEQDFINAEKELQKAIKLGLKREELTNAEKLLRNR